MSHQPLTRPSSAPAPAVLLVDDDASVCHLVHRLLTVNGYRVFRADSCAEAIALWEMHCGEIELLFTDIVLPGEMSGRELASQCQAQNPELKVIFTSGYNLELSVMDGSLKEGVNFLQKPYRPDQLIDAVRAVLAGAITR